MLLYEVVNVETRRCLTVCDLSLGGQAVRVAQKRDS